MTDDAGLPILCHKGRLWEIPQPGSRPTEPAVGLWQEAAQRLIDKAPTYAALLAWRRANQEVFTSIALRHPEAERGVQRAIQFRLTDLRKEAAEAGALTTAEGDESHGDAAADSVGERAGGRGRLRLVSRVGDDDGDGGRVLDGAALAVTPEATPLPRSGRDRRGHRR